MASVPAVGTVPQRQPELDNTAMKATAINRSGDRLGQTMTPTSEPIP